MMPCPPNRKAAKATAFMLLEAVIALGIVVFALVPMIGLLPIGMNRYRDSVDRTTGSRIAQQIFAEFTTGSSDFNDLKTRYFDLLGQETGESNGSDTIYYVTPKATASAELPGDRDSARTLWRVTVEVWYNPAHLATKPTGQTVRDYSFSVCY